MKIRCLGALALLFFTSWIQAEVAAGPACVFPDLSGVAPVPLEAGAGDPAGSADPIPGGRWELESLLYRVSFPIPIAGDATGVLVLDASSPTAGDFSAALDVNITAPTEAMQSETGAGPYEQTGGLLNLTNVCGDALILSNTVYRVETAGPEPVLTLWGEIDIPIKEPVPLVVTIELEADFLLVEPQAADDPVFVDGFEAP